MWLGCAVVEDRKDRTRAMPRPRVWRWVLAGFLAALSLVGFWPSPVDQPVQVHIAVLLFLIHVLGVPSWIDYEFVEAAANVILFVPLGVLVALAFPRKLWWQIGAFGLLITGCMELGQLLFLHSRFPSPLDLATNTAGCLVGFLLVALVVRRPRDVGIS